MNQIKTSNNADGKHESRPKATHYKRRSFVLFAVLIAGCGGYWLTIAINESAQQQTAVEALAETRGFVKYAYPFPMPALVIAFFGKDFLGKPVELSYFEEGYGAMDEWPVSRPKYEAIHRLPSIENLWILDTAFPYEVLIGMPNLERVDVDMSPVSETDVTGIAQISHLRHLSIRHSSLTDREALQLTEMHNLETLDLRGNQLSPETKATLKESLPNCQFTGW